MQFMTLYYDGRCPLCMAEIHMLQARNVQGLLRFVDVTAAGFDEAQHEISCTVALAQMHARLEDGSLLTGAAVFAEAYRRADLPKLAWLLSRPRLQPMWNRLYSLFAKHRHAISRYLGPAMLYFAKRFYKR
jgi:predicted DCC family thiol-disulfide oxidoreductase YuxK